MKKLLFILLTLLMCTSIFAQVQYVEPSELVKTLEKNRKTEITFETELNLNNLVWDNEGNLKLSTVSSEKYSLVAGIETELLRERLNYKNLSKYKVSFQLKSNKPKVYAVTKIEGIESVAEYKARIEAERLARLEAERIAEEKRLEEERLAEEARLEAERIAEEKRLEEERLAEEARLEAERIAEEKRLEEERLAEEARLEAERIAEEKRLEEERIAEEKRQRNAQFLPTYEGHLAKAKKYETEKRWCYALGSYYDAMGTVGLDPEYKTEAVNGYNALKDSILSGKPGFGTFNEFSLHDEWKKLLIDAEKYGCANYIYDRINVGELERGDLDYTTKTASYSAEIYGGNAKYTRYSFIIKVIKDGYEKAYKDDWKDLPYKGNWPKYSASYKKDGSYNINGAYVFFVSGEYITERHYNPFILKPIVSRIVGRYGSDYDLGSLIDCRFNIVDENGNELVKPKRCLLEAENKITFTDITPDIMDLIDNGKAFINPIGCYLQYGKYNHAINEGGRSFVRNLPEVQIKTDKLDFICWNNKTDKITSTFKDLYDYVEKVKLSETFDKEKLNCTNYEMIKIPDLNIEIGKTEVTQELYEIIMGKNPSDSKDNQNPVESISFYDAIYFCNKLSILKGLEPVYSVDGYVFQWDYSNRKIIGKISQNTSANGYRLPSVEEWRYAAKGGENYKYAGSDNIDEVGWGRGENSVHAVSQKKANSYGLYDMTGNVKEWCWDYKEYYRNYYSYETQENVSYLEYYERYVCGGSYRSYSSESEIDYNSTVCEYSVSSDVGFRIVRTVTE